MTAAAALGMDNALMIEISHLSGIKPLTGEKIFADVGGEGIAVLCKATGLKRHYLRELWIAMGRSPEDAVEFARVSQTYESLAVAKAQTVLRYWNWSLSSAFSPEMLDEYETFFDEDERPVSTATRSAGLAFGR